MNTNEIMDAVVKKASGAFFRMRYATEVPTTSAYRKNGGKKITKVVDVTTRTGVKYALIKRVIDRKAEQEAKAVVSVVRKNPYETVVPQRVSKNTETGEMYVNIFPVANGGNMKTSYFVDGVETSLDSIKEFLNKSYVEGLDKVPTMQRVKFSSILSI